MSKFKSGDRVVIARNNTFPDDKERTSRIGSRQIISNGVYDVVTFLGNMWVCNAEDLEFEHIYDSPLYKALK